MGGATAAGFLRMIVKRIPPGICTVGKLYHQYANWTIYHVLYTTALIAHRSIVLRLPIRELHNA